MDLAGGIAAAKVARGRVATVAIDRMSFMVPVQVGAVVSCYTEVISVGRSSIQVQIEVWSRVSGSTGETGSHDKVTEGSSRSTRTAARGRSPRPDSVWAESGCPWTNVHAGSRLA